MAVLPTTLFNHCLGGEKCRIFLYSKDLRHGPFLSVVPFMRRLAVIIVFSRFALHFESIVLVNKFIYTRASMVKE
jgi:hypothetical protein